MPTGKRISLPRFLLRFGLITLLVNLLLLAGLSLIFAAPPAQKPDDQAKGADEAESTNQWAVWLTADANPDFVAAQHGFINLGQVGSLTDVYLFQQPATPIKGRKGDPEQLRSAGNVVSLTQQFARQQYTRQPPTDPLYPDQWHLDNRGQAGGTPGIDVNVLPAWQAGLTGNGVVIGVVDDGLEHSHPDLADNYLAGASFDFNDNDPDPNPGSPFDRHGTAVAGVAAARNNSSCGVGAAYQANLAGLRLISEPTTDADEAMALTHQYNTIDIYSNSWGPFDNGRQLSGPGPLTRAALKDGITNGRNGLGAIYVWAAGNGLSNDDDVNYDGYANSRYTIAIGSIDNHGLQPYYGEPGAAMLVTAPSNGGSASITTSDLVGSQGYDATDCTNTFGGTSASAPLASGVIALMLEKNPTLTWRDVQHILVNSADQTDPGDSDWLTNGAGRLVNHKYGFGRINATTAISLATTWHTISPSITIDSGLLTPNLPIPDNDPGGVTDRITVTSDITLEHVEVIFNAAHTYRGDLKIVLISPAGTESVLSDVHSDSNNNYENWRFMTVRNWGESAAGAWQLRVADGYAGDIGTFDSWHLILHGTGSEIIAGPVVYSNHTMDDTDSNQSTGNGDGQLNPGETIELNVALHNAGVALATNVNACLKEDSSYIIGPMFNPCASFGDIPSGNTLTHHNQFEFAVAPNTPIGHTIHFSMTITATNGGPWLSTFSQTVTASPARLRLHPSTQTHSLYEGSFKADIMVDNALDLSNIEFDLNFDPTIITITQITMGSFLTGTGRTATASGPLEIAAGQMQFGVDSFGTEPGPNGSGTIATLLISPLSKGTAGLTLTAITLTNTQALTTPVISLPGQVTIDGGGSVMLPGLLLNMGVSPDLATAGSPLTYTLTAINNSPLITATQAIITDRLPPQTTFITATHGGQLIGNSVQWSGLTLPPTTTVTVTLVVGVANPFEGDSVVNSTYALISAEGAFAVGKAISTGVKKNPPISSESQLQYLPLIAK